MEANFRAVREHLKRQFLSFEFDLISKNSHKTQVSIVLYIGEEYPHTLNYGKQVSYQSRYYYPLLQTHKGSNYLTS